MKLNKILKSTISYIFTILIGSLMIFLLFKQGISYFSSYTDYLKLENTNLYFGMYPYNIPIAIIDGLFIYLFSFKALLYMQIFNVILFIFVEYGVYLLISHNINIKTANFTVGIMSIFFPLIGYLVVVYNEIYSLIFIIYSLFYFFEYLKYNKIKSIIICILLLCLAIWMRKISIIFLIAYVLYLLIIKFKNSIKISILLIVCYLVFNNFVNFLYVNLNVMESDAVIGIPIQSVIYMGLNDGQDGKSPGYFIGTVEKYVEKSGTFDPIDYKVYVNNLLKAKIDSMSFTDITKHYTYKYFFQWSDGCFETNIINNLLFNVNDSVISMQYQTPLYKFIVQRSKTINFIIWYSRAFWFIMLAFITIYEIIRIFWQKNQDKLLFNKIIILGFIGFLLLTETSPHYSYISLPFFIIMFGFAYSNVVELLSKMIQRRKSNENSGTDSLL